MSMSSNVLEINAKNKMKKQTNKLCVLYRITTVIEIYRF